MLQRNESDFAEESQYFSVGYAPPRFQCARKITNVTACNCRFSLSLSIATDLGCAFEYELIEELTTFGIQSMARFVVAGNSTQ